MLYPLKFKPVFKEKVWGANRLKTLFNKNIAGLKNCGESWEISGIENNPSVIENGFLAGNELAEIIEIYMEDLVGEAVFRNFGIMFPLLFKFIDTADYLSLQVHPGNIPGESSGKAEFWYVLHAEADAEIIAGFNKDITKDIFTEHLNSNTLKEILNINKPKAGDVYYIPPGTIHAIGPGVTLLEIQQASDTTYRVYDWDRKGLDGNKRELHLEKALDTIDYNKSFCIINTDSASNGITNLIRNNIFTVNALEFNGVFNRDYIKIGSFVAYNCLEGEVVLKYNGGKEKLAKGQSVLLPAEIKEIELVSEKNSRVIETYIEQQ